MKAFDVPLPPKWIQLCYQMVQDEVESNSKLMILWPRNHGKNTAITIIQEVENERLRSNLLRRLASSQSS